MPAEPPTSQSSCATATLASASSKPACHHSAPDAKGATGGWLALHTRSASAKRAPAGRLRPRLRATPQPVDTLSDAERWAGTRR